MKKPRKRSGIADPELLFRLHVQVPLSAVDADTNMIK